jgi:hypothetical protein
MLGKPTPRDGSPQGTLDPCEYARNLVGRHLVCADAIERPAALVEGATPLQQRQRLLARIVGERRARNAIFRHRVACAPRGARGAGRLEKGFADIARENHFAPQLALFDIGQQTRQRRAQLALGIPLAQPASEFTDLRGRPDVVTRMDVGAFHHRHQRRRKLGVRRQDGVAGRGGLANLRRLVSHVGTPRTQALPAAPTMCRGGAAAALASKSSSIRVNTVARSCDSGKLVIRKQFL